MVWFDDRKEILNVARLHKVTMFVTDIESDSDLEDDLEDLIVHGLSRYDLSPSCIEVQSSKEFEWDDELKINYTNSTKEDFEKYFE